MGKEYHEHDSRNLMDPLDDNREAMLTYAMFYFQVLREAGHSVEDAKEQTAEMILSAYNKFCETGKITPRLQASIPKRLDKLVNQLKALTKEDKKLYSVYNELVSIQTQMTRSD